MAQPKNLIQQPTQEDLDEDQMREELTELETALSIHHLLTLLQIEVDVIYPLIEKGPQGLSECELLQMAPARELERLGLIALDPEDMYWDLTPKGRVAVKWWRECLADLAPLRKSAPSPT